MLFMTEAIKRHRRFRSVNAEMKKQQKDNMSEEENVFLTHTIIRVTRKSGEVK